MPSGEVQAVERRDAVPRHPLLRPVPAAARGEGRLVGGEPPVDLGLDHAVADPDAIDVEVVVPVGAARPLPTIVLEPDRHRLRLLGAETEDEGFVGTIEDALRVFGPCLTDPLSIGPDDGLGRAARERRASGLDRQRLGRHSRLLLPWRHDLRDGNGAFGA